MPTAASADRSPRTISTVTSREQSALTVLRDLPGGITGDAGQLGALDPEVFEVGGKRRARLARLAERTSGREQLRDERPLVLELLADRPVRRGRDANAWPIEAPLRGDDLASVEQRRSRFTQDLGARFGVGLNAVEREDRVLDVALGERALPGVTSTTRVVGRSRWVA